MDKQKVSIFDIMACNVYWDFENSPMPKETHKFLVALAPTPGAVTPDLIDRVTAFGPDGYTVEFNNIKYDNVIKNGWFYDGNINNYWYMVNLPTGFMKEGEYRIEVKTKDGQVDVKSRVQRNAPSEAAIAAYLKNREQLYESFVPSKTKPPAPGSSLENVKLSWATLKDLADLDAYYVMRLGEASTPMEFDGNKLTWFDNIYLQRFMKQDEEAGKNRSEVVVETELKPKTSYGYFVEITDGNVAGEANVCIFQPHQFFLTP